MSLPTFTWISEHALRVALGDQISEESHARVCSAFAAVAAARIPGLLDTVPAYTTILLIFDPRTLDAARAEGLVRDAIARAGSRAVPPGRTISIPVCYDADFALDLDEVSAALGLLRDEIIGLHSGTAYSVHCVGFSPGFAYLAGLPARLEISRLDSPRTRVPAGSVAIAGKQAGIYPRATPGGWRIIGRTPLTVFDAHREAPSTLRLGDRVLFVPITRAEFERQLRGSA